MDGLKRKVAVRKNTKVLRRIAGCLKKRLLAAGKCEIEESISSYGSAPCH